MKLDTVFKVAGVLASLGIVSIAWTDAKFHLQYAQVPDAVAQATAAQEAHEEEAESTLRAVHSDVEEIKQYVKIIVCTDAGGDAASCAGDALGVEAIDVEAVAAEAEEMAEEHAEEEGSDE